MTINDDVVVHYRNNRATIQCRSRITDYEGQLTENRVIRTVTHREAEPIDCQLDEHHDGLHRHTEDNGNIWEWDDNMDNTPETTPLSEPTDMP